jgi:hypothetical protein
MLKRTIRSFLAFILVRVDKGRNMKLSRSVLSCCERLLAAFLGVLHLIVTKVYHYTRPFVNHREDSERKERERLARHAVLVQAMESIGLAEILFQSVTKNRPMLPVELALLKSVNQQVATLSKRFGTTYLVQYSKIYPHGSDCVQITYDQISHHFVQQKEADKYRAE